MLATGGDRAGFGKPVSLADLIVLGGTAAVEQAASKGGVELEVPFTGPHRRAQEWTDVESFAALEPSRTGSATTCARAPAAGQYLLLDRANLLTLSAPEMTVLVGGLRVLGANHSPSLGRAHRPAGDADQRLLQNLLHLGTEWKASGDGTSATRRAASAGPAAARTWCSARTQRARWPRSTRVTTRTRSSRATSPRRGPRSWTWTA